MSPTDSNPVCVCAAIIPFQGKVLLATRRPGSHLEGLWEFPGGKCQSSESTYECIEREILEELKLAVHAEREFAILRHDYPEKSIELHFIICQIVSSPEIFPQEGQRADFFSPGQWRQLQFAPADQHFLEKYNDALAELCGL